jgi:hypothetical protein
MAKPRDALWCLEGITDTMVEKAVKKLDLENDSDFALMMMEQQTRMKVFLS